MLLRDSFHFYCLFLSSMLRALEPADALLLYEWENDPGVWAQGCTLAPYSLKQLVDYVETYDADIYSARQLRLMIVADDTGDTVGTVDLYDFDPANSRCGVGILVAPPYRRKGYALKALADIAEYCRGRLSLHQLWCVVGAENQASRSLFTCAGYSASGRLRSWLRSAGSYSDAYIYQLML